LLLCADPPAHARFAALVSPLKRAKVTQKGANDATTRLLR
jgi:hypothetical protein